MVEPEPGSGDEYLSCRFIEGNLVLDQDRLMFCCIGRGDTPIGEFHGGPLDETMIRRRREEMRAAVARGEVDPCRGCSHLVRRRWPRARWLVQSMIIAHYKICNLRCSFCSAFDWSTGPAPTDHYPLLPVIQQMQEREQLSPHAAITWGGGEPTILEDFEECLEALGDGHHWINTSGVKFSPALYRALQHGRAHLQCSIDAGSAATFQAIKERDTFDRVWDNLKRYAESGGPVVAKYIVMDSNHTEVRAFLDRVQQTGLQEVVGDLDIQDRPSEQVLDALGLLLAEGARRGLSVTLGGGTLRFSVEIQRRMKRSLDEQFRPHLERLIRRDRWWRRLVGGARRTSYRIAFLAGWKPGPGLRIDSVTPRTGPVKGGEVAYVRGANLHHARSIRFGGQRVGFQLLDPGTARVKVPPFHHSAGMDHVAAHHAVDVRVAAPHKRSTLFKGYVYHPDPC